MTPTLERRLLRGPLTNAGAGAWAPKARKGIGKHLEPGVVSYDNDDGSKITYLLTREAIDKMRPTAAGKPVVGKTGGFDHVKVEEGKVYDGQVTDGFWDGESGWESINFVLDNAETAQACERGFQFSCAYIPTDVDETPGVWHNVPYDAVIRDGEYTHFAVVPNPRYEGAVIELLNSLPGGIMNKVLKGVLSLLPLKDLKEVLNSLEDDEKKKADDKAALEKKNSDRRAEIQAAYDHAMKNASSDEDRAKAKEVFEKANADMLAPQSAPDAAAGASATAEPKADLPPKPLGGGDVTPEPGIPGQAPVKKNADVAAQAAAEGESIAKEKAEQAALEKKNADDAAAKKKADEEKAEKEKTNALAAKVKAKKEADALALRTERFNHLRRLAEERGGDSGTPFVGVTTAQEKEDLGRERYGSRQ